MNRKTLLGFGVGPIGTGLFGLITVPLIAWIFPPEDVGRLYILQTVVSFAVVLLFLGLDQAYVREFHETDDLAALLKSTFFPGLALFVLVAAVGILFAGPLALVLFGVSEPIYLWLTIACVFASFLSRQLSLILRMRERALAFSFSQILPKAVFVGLVGLIAALNLPREFLNLQSALLGSFATVLMVYLWNTRMDWIPAIRARIVGSRLRRLFAFALPLVLSSLAYWGLTATSAFTLRAFSSFDEVGIYSVSMSVAGVAVVFQSIFSVVWAPIVYKWAANGTDTMHVHHVARQSLPIVLGVFVACGMFSWAVDWFLPVHYSMVKYLVICSIVQPLLYTLSEITGIGISITRRTTLSLWATVMALAVNLVLNVSLVPTLGASGAVLANSLAFLTFFVGRTELSALVWLQLPRLKMYSFVLGATALSIGTVLIGPTVGMLVSAGWALAGVISLWAFRGEIVSLIDAMRRAERAAE